MKKILVAVLCMGPHSQEINVGLLETLLQLEKPDGYDIEVTTSYRMPVDANRNHIFKHILDNPQFEWVLMLDSDISPPKDILNMVKWNKDIVSGMIMIMKKNIPQPCAMKLIKGKLRPVILSDFQKREDDLIEVDGIGTGCLLVHRSVIEKIPKPWFKFEYNEDGLVHIGEDYHFSLKVREKGLKIFVDSSKPCGHYKYMDLLSINRLLYDAMSGKFKLKDLWKTKKDTNI
jgi:hypothetical protein